MITPARAGPAARATLTLTMSSRVAAASSVRGTSSVINAWFVDCSTAVPAPTAKVKASSSAGGIRSRAVRVAEQAGHDHDVALHAEDQPAPVERVGQSQRTRGGVRAPRGLVARSGWRSTPESEVGHPLLRLGVRPALHAEVLLQPVLLPSMVPVRNPLPSGL